MIEDEKKPLTSALKAMNMNKATSYYYASKQADDRRKRSLDEGLVQLLKGLEGYDLTYGYRKVTVKFDEYNHKKIYRHMKVLNMLQPKKLKKRKTTRLPISCPIGSDIRWEGDLTYIFDGQRINYLFAIVDAYDKDPIGDCYSLRCRAEEAVQSLGRGC